MKKLLLSLAALVCSATMWADVNTTLIDGITLPSVPTTTYDAEQDLNWDDKGHFLVKDGIFQASAAFYGTTSAVRTWANAADGSDNTSSTSGATWNIYDVFKGSLEYTTGSSNRYVNFARRCNLRTTRTFAYRFTNASSISAFVKSNGNTDAGAAVVAVYELDGSNQTHIETASSIKKDLDIITIDELDKAKTYVAYIYGANGSNGELYEIFFNSSDPSDPPTPPAASNDATLSDIKVDGVTIVNFSPSTTSYEVLLGKDAEVVPTVTYTLNDSKASAVMTTAAFLPGSTKIEVTAEDGTTTLSYLVNFDLQVDPSKPRTWSFNAVYGTQDATDMKNSPSLWGDVTSGRLYALTSYSNQQLRSDNGILSFARGLYFTLNSKDILIGATTSAEKYMQVQKSISVRIPNCQAGDTIVISGRSSSSGKSFTVSSAQCTGTITNGSTSNTFRYDSIFVNATGDVSLNISSYARIGILKVLPFVEKNECAKPTATKGAYRAYDQTWAYTINCAEEGATLSYTVDNGESMSLNAGDVVSLPINAEVVVTATKLGKEDGVLEFTVADEPDDLQETVAKPADKNLDLEGVSYFINGATYNAGQGGAGLNLKLRSGANHGVFVIEVKEGYIITGIHARAANNYADISTLKTLTIDDDAENLLDEEYESGTDKAAYEFTCNGFEASDKIILTFQTDAVESVNGTQVNITIDLTYKYAPVSLEKTVVIKENVGYASLFVGNNVVIPEGVEAYVGSISGNYITLSPLTNYIPANTGVVLKGDAGNYNFITASKPVAELDGDNALVGSATAVTATSLAGDGNTLFALANPNDVVGFYPFNMTGNVTAGKAYLCVPESATASSFRFVFGDEEQGNATQIEHVAIETAEPKVIYNLAGQRVSSFTGRGIYIVNGKKVIVK